MLVYTSATQPGKHPGKQHGEQPGGLACQTRCSHRVATRQSMPSMADIMDVDIVAAITVGLTYFYWKKQSDRQRTVRKEECRRRWWMIKIHQNRTRYVFSDRNSMPEWY
ncbi:hypothetical protein EVAR_85177_1 [Eumeta japonica]|uniref:Uncharacterized protein n=1 Tax=Eumeta variegata TaxID=151549 RepID=A0A4C1ZY27_EUMVA|nr:hypothetical protein EVAR_85177_1 [Eumeta japonica]